MKKILYKMCLCGILIWNIDNNIVYSVEEKSLQFTSQIVLDNIPITNSNDFNNKEINGNHIIGYYNTNKFYVDNNILYENDKVFCKLKKKARDYGIFNMSCPYTGTIIYNNKDYIVFPITTIQKSENKLQYHFTKSSLHKNNRPIIVNNNSISDYDFINNISILDNVNKSGVNIMCIQLQPKYPKSLYKLSKNNLKILHDVPLAKFDSNINKWYETDENGNYIIDKTTNKRVELSKSKVIIPFTSKITLLDSEDKSDPTAIEISPFGKLINIGVIEANENTSIYGQGAIQESYGSYKWNNIISNLEDVAIQNDNGEIIFKSGSTISTKDKLSFPVIKGGTVDISDLIEFTGNSIILKNDDMINAGFYDVHIKLFSDDFPKQQNYDEILTYLSNNDNFSNTTEPIFKNMKFFSESPSTINMLVADPSVTVQLNMFNTNKCSYNTRKSVIKSDGSNIDFPYNVDNISNNVLRLFYTENDINKFRGISPLTVKYYYTDPIELHTFLSNPSLYIHDYSTKTKYGIDLFTFSIDNNTIDYSKITSEMPKNIQFVINTNYKWDRNLILKPAIDEITIGPEFNNYPGILLLDSSVKKLNIINNNKNTNLYTIRMNEGIKIKTKGNIKLLLNNNGIIKLEGIRNISGILSIFPYKNNDTLAIEIPVSKSLSVFRNNIKLHNIGIIIAS